MAIKTTGFNDLIKEFQNLDIKIQNQTSATAIDKASEVVKTKIFLNRKYTSKILNLIPSSCK